MQITIDVWFGVFFEPLWPVGLSKSYVVIVICPHKCGRAYALISIDELMQKNANCVVFSRQK